MTDHLSFSTAVFEHIEAHYCKNSVFGASTLIGLMQHILIQLMVCSDRVGDRLAREVESLDARQ